MPTQSPAAPPAVSFWFYLACTIAWLGTITAPSYWADLARSIGQLRVWRDGRFRVRVGLVGYKQLAWDRRKMPGVAPAQVATWLRERGIPVFARYQGPTGRVALRVPGPQAAWAEEILLRAGLPLTNRLEPATQRGLPRISRAQAAGRPLPQPWGAPSGIKSLDDALHRTPLGIIPGAELLGLPEMLLAPLQAIKVDWRSLNRKRPARRKH